MPALPSSRRPALLLCAVVVASVSWACPPAFPEVPNTGDGGQICAYVASDLPACCNGGKGCTGGLQCNTMACACEDIVSPCASGVTTLPDGGPVDPGVVPAGTVTADGGTVERLWFATTGDTRPGNCDDTANYPVAAINQVTASMKALKVQFAVDLGDHMFVCNGSRAEAQEQMGYYMGAVAKGPSAFFMTMGNHECGHFISGPDGARGCFPGFADANFDTFMAALTRPQPYYSFDVQTTEVPGLARFVIIADDSFTNAQRDWLEATLADADAKATYTIITRHHPMSNTSYPGVNAVLARHKYSLILTAHSHTYNRGSGWDNRAPVIGIGGAPGDSGVGFVTVEQKADGTLQVVPRDSLGHPNRAAWSVTARTP